MSRGAAAIAGRFSAAAERSQPNYAGQAGLPDCVVRAGNLLTGIFFLLDGKVQKMNDGRFVPPPFSRRG